ncbi:hypothetical protein DR64_6732 [Paraburkholderia xenovorans LB400]|nr:hypothetical protein DR64_6732 [Paraburkholderia xenovorans LB400]
MARDTQGLHVTAVAVTIPCGLLGSASAKAFRASGTPLLPDPVCVTRCLLPVRPSEQYGKRGARETNKFFDS